LTDAKQLLREARKIVIAPDSFKGTLDARSVCDIISDVIRRHNPHVGVVGIPIADGGEGTVDSIIGVRGGERIVCDVTGPFGDPLRAVYGVTSNAAVIETAAAAGLSLAHGRQDPSRATTFGVGEMIRDAVLRGHDRIMVGLGGSCTNDAGTGIAAALGTKFLDASGKAFVPAGGTLSKVSCIDTSECDSLLSGVSITAMCDIDTPMYGLNGAAYVFGSQKGADDEMVAILDDQLRSFAETLRRVKGIDVESMRYAGAAGAAGAGIRALLGGRLEQGIDVLFGILGFDDIIHDADLIITGEGCLDAQSLLGKVVIGIGRRAKSLNVPVIAVVGRSDIKRDALTEEGILAVVETASNRNGFDDIRDHARYDLAVTMERLLS
jgi:glycerate kinase